VWRLQNGALLQSGESAIFTFLTSPCPDTYAMPNFSARRAYTRRSRQTSAVFAAAIDDAARFKQSRTAG